MPVTIGHSAKTPNRAIGLGLFRGGLAQGFEAVVGASGFWNSESSIFTP